MTGLNPRSALAQPRKAILDQSVILPQDDDARSKLRSARTGKGSVKSESSVIRSLRIPSSSSSITSSKFLGVFIPRHYNSSHHSSKCYRNAFETLDDQNHHPSSPSHSPENSLLTRTPDKVFSSPLKPSGSNQSVSTDPDSSNSSDHLIILSLTSTIRNPSSPHQSLPTRSEASGLQDDQERHPRSNESILSSSTSSIRNPLSTHQSLPIRSETSERHPTLPTHSLVNSLVTIDRDAVTFPQLKPIVSTEIIAADPDCPDSHNQLIPSSPTSSINNPSLPLQLPVGI